MPTLVSLATVCCLLLFGFVAGGWADRTHLRSLERREQALRGVWITDLGGYPGLGSCLPPPALVAAEVVISSDYFRTFLASLRQLFGGEVGAYRTLMARARREATLRLWEAARAGGHNALCNVRLESADIGGTTARRAAAMVAIVASATAYSSDSTQPPADGPRRRALGHAAPLPQS